MPAGSLSEDAPLLQPPDRRAGRSRRASRRRPRRAARARRRHRSICSRCCTTRCGPIASTTTMLFLNTVAGPGRRRRGAAPRRAGRADERDPRHGRDHRRQPPLVRGRSRVRAWRWSWPSRTLNLACVGAEPKAVVNCLNFGNPEHPEVMWQFSETIDGMGEACRALKTPVVGGNVSVLQREPRRRTSTRRRSSARSA